MYRQFESEEEEEILLRVLFRYKATPAKKSWQPTMANNKTYIMYSKYTREGKQGAQDVEKYMPPDLSKENKGIEGACPNGLFLTFMRGAARPDKDLMRNAVRSACV